MGMVGRGTPAPTTAPLVLGGGPGGCTLRKAPWAHSCLMWQVALGGGLCVLFADGGNRRREDTGLDVVSSYLLSPGVEEGRQQELGVRGPLQIAPGVGPRGGVGGSAAGLLEGGAELREAARGRGGGGGGG